MWSLNECHFQQHGARSVMGVPSEETDPVLLPAPTRKSVALCGAVNLRQGQRVTQVEPKFDGSSFGRFLRHLLRHRARGRRLTLILDNAPYHHARLLKPFWHRQRRVLRFDYLPPYSPELNPIERVWKLARRLSTHNQYFPELQDLIDAVSRQMAAWAKTQLYPSSPMRRHLRSSI